MHPFRLPRGAGPAALLLALAALAPAGPGRPRAAAAEPPPSAPRAAGGEVDLSAARVLASPGWPAALQGFLPARRGLPAQPEPLALPLPPGPLLLLGLASDPVARALGETLLGIAPDEPLAGGYVAEAWHDGARAVGFVLAADAAALAAARFELETFTPEEMAGAPRSTEFTQPDEQAGVRMAAGRRCVRPRFAWRGAGGLGPEESAFDLAAAHANRALVGGALGAAGRARLAEHGVLPVVPLALLAGGRARLPAPDGAERGPLERAAALEVLRAWQARGVRAFALERGAGPEAAPEPLEALAERWAADLRAGGLDELLVLEDGGGAPPPRLAHVPEALLGWRGPHAAVLAITRDDAARAAAVAGVPLVLVEDWAEAQAGDPPRLASAPRGRDPRLPEVLEGVLVRPGPGGAEILASAWDAPPAAEAVDGLADLQAACALEPLAPAAFLARTAERLEAGLAGRVGLRAALARLPAHLRREAERLPAPAHVLTARLVPAPVEVDGRLDDRAWGFAVPQRVGPVDVLALSDGRRLVLGLRAPPEAGVQVTVTLRLRRPDGALAEAVWSNAIGRPPPAGVAAPVPVPAPVPALDAEVRSALRSGAREAELALDHYDLGGAPYPTRTFDLDLVVESASGTARLGPAAASGEGGAGGATGRLVVVR